MGSEHVRPRASLPREVQGCAPQGFFFFSVVKFQQFWYVFQTFFLVFCKVKKCCVWFRMPHL